MSKNEKLKIELVKKTKKKEGVLLKYIIRARERAYLTFYGIKQTIIEKNNKKVYETHVKRIQTSHTNLAYKPIQSCDENACGSKTRMVTNKAAPRSGAWRALRARGRG